MKEHMHRTHLIISGLIKKLKLPLISFAFAEKSSVPAKPACKAEEDERNTFLHLSHLLRHLATIQVLPVQCFTGYYDTKYSNI